MSEAIQTPEPFREKWLGDDWLAVWLGGMILLVALLGTHYLSTYKTSQVSVENPHEIVVSISNPLKAWTGKPGGWKSSPFEAFSKADKKTGKVTSLVPAIAGSFSLLLALFTLAAMLRKVSLSQNVPAFLAMFGLAFLGYLLSGQAVIKYYNLEYVLWALLVGLVISNTIGIPNWLKPAVHGELYIKTGLVLLGAEVLFGRLLELGIPGIMVSWIVTPIVLIGTFVFGQKILKMSSPTLNMVISADMSVCGVSAAIATGAACRAKKEELTTAISLSLAFTVLMMILQPMFIKWTGMDERVGAAWIGGTIDSTGAVAAAGEHLGKQGLEIASTIKMIQNILIGVISFAVAVYWVSVVDRQAGNSQRISAMEIWYRFPRFILGFVAASVLFSWLSSSGELGWILADSTTSDVTKDLRGWLFCLAFVSIGLETNFKQLAPYFRDYKTVTLYIVGQSFNLLLTFLMAYLAFGVLYPGVG